MEGRKRGTKRLRPCIYPFLFTLGFGEKRKRGGERGQEQRRKRGGRGGAGQGAVLAEGEQALPLKTAAASKGQTDRLMAQGDALHSACLRFPT